MYVLKIGGSEIDQPDFLAELCAAIRDLPGPGVIVHGGGKEIAAALSRHGLPYEMVEGIRITNEAAMVIVEQVLSGGINKRLVRMLNAIGLNAIGLSGADLDLIQTNPLVIPGYDLGRVGEIATVRAEMLHAFINQGWLPVISPVSVDRTDHGPTNVNADHVALALAAALQAKELIFVSNVPGVLLDDAVVPYLSPLAIEQAIAAGTITGGMIPKVRSAVAALDQVLAVRITNLAGLINGGTSIKLEV